VARRVAVRLDDCRSGGLESQLDVQLEGPSEESEGGGRTGRDALLRHREERVRRRCGADGVDGDLERAVGAVLEADCVRGASESASAERVSASSEESATHSAWTCPKLCERRAVSKRRGRA